MNIEFEIKILDIDKEYIREKLKYLGAEYVGKKDYRRYVYDLVPKDTGKWIRLRTDGKQTTLTYKHITDGDSIAGVKEAEILVGDFDATHNFLQVLGFTPKAYQENIRESYQLNGCNIELDSRPMIPSYLEIEGLDEGQVKTMVKTLGLEDRESTSQNTIQVYKRYGINDFEAYTHISFEKFEKKFETVKNSV